MASATVLIFFLFFFLTIVEGGKKKNVDKIVIHVPYKILKHHHTHTKFKVIKNPTPKKESTVIYLKEELQPIINHDSPTYTPTEENKIQTKTPESFIPPHEQSATSFLQSPTNHKKQTLLQTQQQQHCNIIMDNRQKLLNSHSDQSTDFELNFSYKPILLPSESNFVPNFDLKPILLPSQYVFTPQQLFNEEMYHSYKAFFPKSTHQPMLHLPQNNFNQKLFFKPFPEKIQDNVSPASSQIYKTMVHPRQKSKSYKVKEENQENKMQLTKHQGAASSATTMSSLIFSKKGKMHFLPIHNHQIKTVKNKIQSNPDYEYEHVGYLITDGNSRQIIGKNFEDQIHFNK